MNVSTQPQAALLFRFEVFIGRVKQAIVGRLERGGEREGLGPLGLVLWSYLGRTLRRLAMLHTRVLADTLRPARTRSTSVSTRNVATRRGLPRGPVLLRFHAVHLAPVLAALIDDPEMQALIAAAPQAGKILRPLWRRLSPERLPACLLPPARRRVSRAKAKPLAAAAPASESRRPRPPGHRAGRPAQRWTPHWAPHGPMPPVSRRAPSPSG